MIILLITALHDTAAPWEVAWTLFPLLGMFFSSWLIWDCWKDLQATNQDSDSEEIDHIAARQAVRNESMILTIHLFLFAAGIVAILSPSNTKTGNLTVVGAVVTTGIVATAVLLPIKSLLNRIDRHRIVVLYRQSKAEKEAGC